MKEKPNPCWMFGRERGSRFASRFHTLRRSARDGKGPRKGEEESERQIRVCATASIKVAGRLAAPRNIRADILTERSRNSRLADKQRAVAGRWRSAVNRDGDSRAISFRLQQSANSRCKYFPADRGGAEETDRRMDTCADDDWLVSFNRSFSLRSSTFSFRYQAFSPVFSASLSYYNFHLLGYLKICIGR